MTAARKPDENMSERERAREIARHVHNGHVLPADSRWEVIAAALRAERKRALEEAATEADKWESAVAVARAIRALAAKPKEAGDG